MIKEIIPIEEPEGQGTIASCAPVPSLNKRSTEDGTPYLNAGSINVFMNMPCPLKVLAKRALKTFADEYNAMHEVKIYSPVLVEGDSKGIEGELKHCKTEEELPEVLVASGLHTVLSKGFKKRFIDSGIYEPATTPVMLQKMTPGYRRLVTENNIAIVGTGFWGIVCDLSVSVDVPYPSQWMDLAKPEYKDLISVHGYHGKASIVALLLLFRERGGDEAIVKLGSNIRNIWHFAEILKRMDSEDKRRMPFNLLPNAATVQMPVRKNAGILEFEEGPLLAPLLMYVKASKRKACKPVVDFFLGQEMRRTLLRGDFHMADEFDWNAPHCYPDWKPLLSYDNAILDTYLNDRLKEGLRKEAFSL
jgi:hypothetical protein